MTAAEELREEGRKEGRKEGREEGRKEASFLLLSLLLKRKFGEEVPQDILQLLNEASSEDLIELGKNLLNLEDFHDVRRILSSP